MANMKVTISDVHHKLTDQGIITADSIALGYAGHGDSTPFIVLALIATVESIGKVKVVYGVRPEEIDSLIEGLTELRDNVSSSQEEMMAAAQRYADRMNSR